ncbi:MAG TPA: toll/interleukin-1 receptor domain-containing protein, partial [Vicinamibacterales bacterium]|nr:toll/interleukin-1 receptor domain-containing protein [Vicinamibacterales bacterium]
MRVLDHFTVARRHGTGAPATIELLEGDLSAIPPEHAVDALVVSAFPYSYTPDPGTLFQALLAHGLDMQEVAQSKEEDQRSRLGCWISRPLPTALAQKFNFRRIVCFEPRYPAFVTASGFDGRSIEQTVGFVFRCLNNFVIPETSADTDREDYEIARIAMPLLATGNQGVPVDALLPELLDAAIFWLEEGLPIERLKIVAFSPREAAMARQLFSRVASAHRAAVGKGPREGARARWATDLALSIGSHAIDAVTRQLRALATDDERATLDAVVGRLERDRAARSATATPSAGATGDPLPEYDVFVSYAHKQDAEVREFVEALQRRDGSLRVFYDRQSISVGGQWIKLISDAIHKSRTFMAVLSP